MVTKRICLPVQLDKKLEFSVATANVTCWMKSNRLSTSQLPPPPCTFFVPPLYSVVLLSRHNFATCSAFLGITCRSCHGSPEEASEVLG